MSCLRVSKDARMAGAKGKRREKHQAATQRGNRTRWPVQGA